MCIRSQYCHALGLGSLLEPDVQPFEFDERPVVAWDMPKHGFERLRRGAQFVAAVRLELPAHPVKEPLDRGAFGGRGIR